MAPLALGENGRTKFTGNAGFYLHQYRYRARVFLPRNINTVLEANEAARLRQSELAIHKSSKVPRANGTNEERTTRTPQRRRPKKTIQQILNSLQPHKPTPGSYEESRLKIDVKTLKWNPHPSPRQVPTKSTRNRQPVTLRCRVQLKIWYLKNGTASEGVDDTLLMVQENELCTITYNPDSDDSPATIDMDDYFIIKAGKLFVYRPEDGQKQEFRFADGYRFELRLLRVDSDKPWPPLVSSIPGWGDLSNVSLVATVDIQGSRMPSTSEHKVYFYKLGSKRQRSNLSLDIDHKWAYPQLSELATPSRFESFRLPTPSSESRELEGSNGLTTLTAYTFLTAIEKPKYHSWFGPPDPKGQHSFCVRGFSCVFCDGRQFPSCNFLKFHFATAHELFHFKVRPRKPMSGLRSGDESYDQIIEVLVDLSKETVVPRASNDVPDPRTCTWIKPVKDFDPQRIVKGDWSWLNEKKGITALGYRRTGSTDEGPTPPAREKIDWNNIPDMPQRPRRRIKVPKPRSHLTGKIYVRTQSKRYVEVGEELSDSDNDVDEEWLIRKHEETICDFEDIATNEHEFLKLWDRHMFEERIISFCHVGPSLYRFAKKHAHRLREGPLLVEFWKHCLNHLQFRTIDTEVLRVVMEVVKGGKDNWSSYQKTQWGIGLYGPLVLDELTLSAPSSPTETRRRSSARKAGKAPISDKMDIDEPLIAPKREQNDVEMITPPEREGYGICICRGGWMRSDMLRCDGLSCDTRWFHRSCMEVEERWLKSWVCPRCREAENADEDS